MRPGYSWLGTSRNPLRLSVSYSGTLSRRRRSASAARSAGAGHQPRERSHGQTRDRKNGLIVISAMILNPTTVIAISDTNTNTALALISLARSCLTANHAGNHHDLFRGGIKAVNALRRLT